MKRYWTRSWKQFQTLSINALIGQLAPSLKKKKKKIEDHHNLLRMDDIRAILTLIKDIKKSWYFRRRNTYGKWLRCLSIHLILMQWTQMKKHLFKSQEINSKIFKKTIGKLRKIGRRNKLTNSWCRGCSETKFIPLYYQRMQFYYVCIGTLLNVHVYHNLKCVVMDQNKLYVNYMLRQALGLCVLDYQFSDFFWVYLHSLDCQSLE